MVRFRKRRFSNVGLPDNLLGAIGHVTALWAQLEFTIDKKISEILDLPGAPKINPKLLIPFNQRLELLDRLCKQFLLVNAENRKYAAEIIADLKLLVGMRNLIVHGAVAHSKQRRKRQIVYWFRRVSWDKPVRIVEKRAMTAKDVESFARRISDRIATALLIEAFFWSVERALHGKSAP